MPAADYMNAVQRGFFRQRLLEMRREMFRRVQEHDAEERIDARVPDPVDRATAEEERFLAQRLGDRELAELREIEAALLRLEEGRYGFCLKSGQPIGIPRLLIEPTATLAAEVEELEEQQAAHREPRLQSRT